MAKDKQKKKEGETPKSIQNRRARFDYAIEDSIETGVVLVGSEVKSVFKGRANLTDSFCIVRGGELWLINADIEPYENTAAFIPERRRDRKLLAHRREIVTLERKAMEKGFALIPTSMYFKNGKVKVQVAMARGKKEYDKRDQIAKDDTRREVERMRSMRI
ncbi:MAG: SsrA-binding protein SmpB [Fimbriimonas sp.]